MQVPITSSCQIQPDNNSHSQHALGTSCEPGISHFSSQIPEEASPVTNPTVQMTKLSCIHSSNQSLYLFEKKNLLNTYYMPGLESRTRVGKCAMYTQSQLWSAHRLRGAWLWVLGASSPGCGNVKTSPVVSVGKGKTATHREQSVGNGCEPRDGFSGQVALGTPPPRKLLVQLDMHPGGSLPQRDH